ncbi:MAG: hypothetical protein JRI23_14745 [Deltaproteobacteria bacterium]|jgi:hypothetical protein|nr:hypothetical protein [Deltaproteobacteria bacterium]MBW2533007.1 hypothetical protein [Deltaproteobacteria bacterium]
MSRLLPAALLVAGALAGLAGCEEVRPPVFPHRAHLTASACGEPGLPDCATCTSCHGKLRQAETVPTEPPSDCVRCHASPDAAVRQETDRLSHRVPRPRANFFTHAVHLDLPEVRGRCVSCHAGVAQDGMKDALYPDMPSCLECHDAEFRAGECTYCHRGDSWRKTAPATFVRHDLRFLRDHRLAANAHGHTCRNCHAQSECTECHDSSQTLSVATRRVDAIERDLIHRGDFLSRHAIESRSQPASCLRCHAQQSCDGCHVDRGVSAAAVGSVNPHPVGWLGRDTTAADYHGRKARRDVVSCAGCHDQGPATNCIRCHRVGSLGGTPHPSGWTSERDLDEGMCGYCHVP